MSAEMMEAELFSQLEQKPKAADPRKLTFPAFYAIWLAENEGILREAYTHKFRSVANLVESFRPGMTLGELDEDFMRDYRRHLLAKGSTDATTAKEYTAGHSGKRMMCCLARIVGQRTLRLQ